MQVRMIEQRKYGGARHSPGSVVDVEDTVGVQWIRRGIAEYVEETAPKPELSEELLALMEAVPTLSRPQAEAIEAAGYADLDALAAATDEELDAAPGVGEGTIAKIREVYPAPDGGGEDDESQDESESEESDE